MNFIVELAYYIAAVLFIIGLKQMASPTTAQRGIQWAGAGMVLATVVTFVHPSINTNYILIILAIAIGGGLAWKSAKTVAMTDMPQMIALYNGMGGGAAAAIAAVELMKHHGLSTGVQTLAVVGALIGAIAFAGSGIAFAKLQGIKAFRASIRFPNQQLINGVVFAVAVLLGLVIIFSGNDYSLFILALFFVAALAFGVLMTLPIGGADMPVVISLYNAFTGLAVGFEGYVLDNPAMMIAGMVVGSAGTLLTQLMAKAMNRPISNVLFSQFGTSSGEEKPIAGSMKAIEAQDSAIMLAFAEKVIVIPGYGMAVAQAQHKVWELCKLLQQRGVMVKFAIHPVAGRMPGHMNVLLAEAGVPYDLIYDLDEINEEFKTADVAVVIGANDVVNPVALTDPASPIYGMPILNAQDAKNVIVIKRGQGAGFSGVENHLFYADNCRMLYGDGQAAANDLIHHIKEL
ncbi:NAD(P)(+) transhydrogenase (Re/Si-specific) subunit beta [Thiofilum flexile]|uniref:NAD(P)(+) transhydrogenase (Re/Si-specific) subunit beta n=1 Tax=Thiofilum flexile TaxID=125627 RepID=UPI00037CAEDC|nr:NAD(P)(+) transhydrogenase (Re/Si-specific) subunit beta [Thiofilum flexile]